MNKLIISLLAAFASMSGLAQEVKFLQKAEVEGLAEGKKWNLVRLRDQAKISWDIRKGGVLFANNFTNNVSDKGTWSINDQGQICIKWRGGSSDACNAIARDAEKLKLFSSDSKSVISEITVE